VSCDWQCRPEGEGDYYTGEGAGRPGSAMGMAVESGEFYSTSSLSTCREGFPGIYRLILPFRPQNNVYLF